MPAQITVLVLGATGMLGNAVFRYMSDDSRFDVLGTSRSVTSLDGLPKQLRYRVMTGVDVEQSDHVSKLLERLRPAVLINCIGLVKQLAAANDPLITLPINSLLPHQLARAAAPFDTRLVHISTDCVFCGNKGGYKESDNPDALDLYGRSKLLGEVDYDNAITLRTSVIGYELASANGLLGWFLSQSGSVKGFTKAVFSGLPTVELARVICDHVVPNPEMRGLYHVSSEPISKYDLLRLIAAEYEKRIEIVPDDRFEIDRSLDSSRFRSETGYSPPSWPALLQTMHEFG